MHSHSRGFTLVELLVVIAIIGILVGLLLPAVQAARESARNTHCLNHLKQLSLACMNHESAFKRFPSCGWNHNSTGDPDYGLDPIRQPGGWIFHILPFIERQVMFDMGSGQPFATKRDIFRQRNAMPIPDLYCPSRRDPVATPNGYGTTHWNSSVPATPDGLMARNDYAAYMGLRPGTVVPNPQSHAEGLAAAWPPHSSYVGVMYHRSNIKIKNITDGTSKTYLIGEKFMDLKEYLTGNSIGDNGSALDGASGQNTRGGFDLTDPSPPEPDRAGAPWQLTARAFGSAHAAHWNVGMCDGSARSMSYEIAINVHMALGTRAGGEMIDPSQY